MRALIVVAVAWVALLPARAWACRCLEANLEYPSDGSVGISRAAVLVVATINPLRAVLRDQTGNEVALRKLEPAAGLDGVSCLHRTLLEPESQLLPDHPYAVELFDASGMSKLKASFTTGQESALSSSDAELELSLNRLIPSATCTDSRCIPEADVQVPAVPLSNGEGAPGWLVLDGTGNGPAAHYALMLSGVLSTSRSIALAMANANDCVAYQYLDARGQIVRGGQLCKASKCLALPPRFAGGLSSCGTLVGKDPALWERVGADSCRSPPTLGQGGLSEEPLAVDAVDQPDGAELAVGADQGGCCVGDQTARGAWLAAAGLALCMRRRRRLQP